MSDILIGKNLKIPTGPNLTPERTPPTCKLQVNFCGVRGVYSRSAFFLKICVYYGFSLCPFGICSDLFGICSRDQLFTLKCEADKFLYDHLTAFNYCSLYILNTHVASAFSRVGREIPLLGITGGKYRYFPSRSILQ